MNRKERNALESIKLIKIQKNLNLANEKLAKLNNYDIGYTEDKTIWYPILKSDQFPIVSSKVKVKDLPNIPLSKINNLYPIQYIDGGNLDEETQ